jgi:hypothetical protein
MQGWRRLKNELKEAKNNWKRERGEVMMGIPE